MILSEHITLERACHSETAIRLGINNFPMNPDFIEAMKLVAEKVFEPCLKACPTASISSFYRCDKLNAAIGGASKNGVQTSQHCKGEAIDIITKGFNKDLFFWVKSNLVFDELIWEFGDTNSPAWVHVSYVEGKPNRKLVLRAYRDKTGTHYIPFDL
jgi:hypothetical protein